METAFPDCFRMVDVALLFAKNPVFHRAEVPYLTAKTEIEESDDQRVSHQLASFAHDSLVVVIPRPWMAVVSAVALDPEGRGRREGVFDFETASAAVGIQVSPDQS
jgi:hypothetical protein